MSSLRGHLREFSNLTPVLQVLSSSFIAQDICLPAAYPSHAALHAGVVFARGVGCHDVPGPHKAAGAPHACWFGCIGLIPCIDIGAALQGGPTVVQFTLPAAPLLSPLDTQQASSSGSEGSRGTPLPGRLPHALSLAAQRGRQQGTYTITNWVTRHRPLEEVCLDCGVTWTASVCS